MKPPQLLHHHHLALALVATTLAVVVVAAFACLHASALSLDIGKPLSLDDLPHRVAPERDVKKKPTTELNPVIAVMGLTSSHLLAKLDDDHEPSRLCPTSTKDWYQLWPPAVEYYLPPYIFCFLHNIEMLYSAENNTFSNQAGVTTRPKDFGLYNASSFVEIVLQKLAPLGYTEDNVLGASYDWRPDGHSCAQDGQYADLVTLIEQTYTAFGNLSVHFITHSNGVNYAYYFLAKYVSQEWKDRYVKTFITLNGPWLGTPTADAYLLPTIAGLPSWFPVDDYLNAIRSFGSIVSLMPLEDTWNDSTPIVSTPSKNYTVNQQLELLQDANASVPFFVRENNFKDFNDVPPPGVATYCIYGYGLPSPYTFIYANDNFTQLAGVWNVSGDSAITENSLNFCQTWIGQQKQNVSTLPLFNSSHNGILNDDRAWNYIYEIIEGDE